MRNLFNKLFRRNSFPVTKHETKYAFTCNGTEYYQFADFNNTPALRGMKTMVYFEELRMKCTLDFLKLHTEAIDNILTNKTKIDIFAIKKLNDQLKQRLDLALDTELLYKIGSIVFFDKSENIEDYDYDYNRRKIENWKTHEGADFFLQQPLQELAPALKDMNVNLQAYSLAVEKLNQLHLDSLLQHLPESKTSSSNAKDYFSLAVMPQSSKQ